MPPRLNFLAKLSGHGFPCAPIPSSATISPRPDSTDCSSAISRTSDIFAALPAVLDLLLVEEAGSVFFTDVRYDTQAHEEVKAAKVVIARKAVMQAMVDAILRNDIAVAADGTLVSKPNISRSPTRSGWRS